jgi:hypothetical protein
VLEKTPAHNAEIPEDMLVEQRAPGVTRAADTQL